ncbi:beta-glucosidase [Nocardioides sp. Root1257]|uniref:glycoside hydrolase family 1 protein n=1 Tax=unclassified Nocardioides TaxID=2615069 RepID=UPI0006F6A486|nr:MULTISPECIES: family 1 glycosylhydrolase [unclassified Nocardioides]KQW50661.1 beta-glucosidase [Nocardioides sp. Root1257]KRC51487.1 beta-glucosidase [Nocardioides sp. Root224]
MTDLTFPDGFLWGAAGAGHQIEGGNSNSDTWFAEQVNPSVFQEPSGLACDSWNRWREDIGLVVAMGLTSYRFSVEWARVEPAEGVFDEEALDRYAAMVDECVAQGLAPVVTFNHFTSPHWFACRGSWLDPEAPALFARYCDRLMERFGDRIAYAVTLNEPNLPHVLSWLNLPDFVRQVERATLEAASEKAGVPAYRLANVVLPEELDRMEDGLEAGHLAAKAVIKARRPDLPVGLSLAMMDDVVDGDDPTVRDRKRAECYQRWLDLVRDDDFLGVQNYERMPYDADGAVAPAPGVPTNQMGTAIEPLSLAGAVRYAYERTGVPILVTEHGLSTHDDTLRAAFLEPSLAGLRAVMDEGVPVLGYIHWTLLDNFEWVFGYAHQIGLHEVDRETFERTPKPSAGVYADLVKSARA